MSTEADNAGSIPVTRSKRLSTTSQPLMKRRATTIIRGCQSAFALWIGMELPTGHHLIGITRDAGTGRIDDT